MGLLKRILWVLAGASVFLVFVSLMRSQATPIRPDLNKVLQQPRNNPGQFPLARAGWNGPEVTPPSHAGTGTYDEFGPEASARHARASLLAAATPDYRAVAGILLVIMLLRRIQQSRKLAPASAIPGKDPTAIKLESGENPRNLKRAA